MTGYIGLGLLANALLVGLALSIGRQLFVNELAGTVFGPASAVFYDTLLAYLQRGWQVLVGLGLILLVTAWFTGINNSAPQPGVRSLGRWRQRGRADQRPGRQRRPVGGAERALAAGRGRGPWSAGAHVGQRGIAGSVALGFVITIALLALLQILVGASSVSDESGQDAGGPEGEAPAGEPVDSSASASGTSS